MYKILLIAAEKSADQLAAALIQNLKNNQEIDLFGIGGNSLKAQGMRLLIHMDQMAFMGVGEILRKLPFIQKVKQKVLATVDVERPDLAILVDYPGFNLRLARYLHERGIRVIYYISPKLWAWGGGRIKKIQKYVDHMIVLFPFEEKFYQQHQVPVSYAGHPLVDELQPHLKKINTSDSQKRCLGILPGSRKQEVRLLLKEMLETARQLHQAEKIDSAEILKVPGLSLDLYREHLRVEDTFIQIIEKPMHEALPGYDAAIVASGTATLETGYFEVPMLIVYRVNAITYRLAKMLVKLTHVGLVNIVAEKEVAKELIQQDFKVESAVEELSRLLEPETNKHKREELQIIREKLGAPGAAKRAAEVIEKFMVHEKDVNQHAF